MTELKEQRIHQKSNFRKDTKVPARRFEPGIARMCVYIWWEGFD